VATDCIASTIGAGDLMLGVDYVLARAAGNGLPLVSANVMDEETGKPVTEEYLVVKRGGIAFGITGVADPTKEIRLKSDVGTAGVTIVDAKEALARVVPEIRKKADFVVLLAQLGQAGAKAVVTEVEGIDFVVVGDQRGRAVPYEHGNAVFLQPGYRGQYIADYRLSFDEKRAYLGYEGEVVTLGGNVPSDAAMGLMLKEHKTAIEEARRRQLAEQASARESQRSVDQPPYEEDCLGAAGACRRCHTEEYDHWATTKHAHAYETLEHAHQAVNPACLRCHTTCRLDLAQDGSQTVPGNLRNVQCESCHGMGTEHARDGSYGKITVETCLACHDKENSPDFDFATYLAQVVHGQ